MARKPLSTAPPVIHSPPHTNSTTAPKGLEWISGGAPKDPEVRLRVLADTGRVNVPFTTGILVDIGENRTERAESRSARPNFGHFASA